MNNRFHTSSLRQFRESLDGAGCVQELREGLVGEGSPIPGAFGDRPLVYADYVASGRALHQIEDFVMSSVLPFYANSHTDASFCGGYMTRLRNESRETIAQLIGADDEYAVIFTGSGATAGVNRLVSLFGVDVAARRGERPLVIIGPYEHHSNILPWRESGAEVIAVPEGKAGGPDLAALKHILEQTRDRALRVGAFSAASNVTGIVTDVDAVTALLNSENVLTIWDYAGGAPYLPIDVRSPHGVGKDAIVLSPHKFIGGPGASGLLVVRKSAVVAKKPTLPGGGSVSFVSLDDQDYLDDLSAREEAGTPNVVGDIRAGLVFLIKDAIGQEFIDKRNSALGARAISVWKDNPALELLGIDKGPRLPIFSMRVLNDGSLVHHQLFTKMLSDSYGIQARGGCACAGPYAHHLLGIDEATSQMLREKIKSGDELAKPGWVRLNFSYLMDDEKADYIIRSVDALARDPSVASRYAVDKKSARFKADKVA
ncbi:aminotransferase class V-fold PLP-dependent enzyme [Stappia sp. ES.058]|uniref:aminotransferase class V-fold PLP-dependent enzyme n=1 Tax=Stappia sp. ES.058 TaxID=1881061 RepID=UPI00087D8311|nr:aminotransferase class V-fold PLP-dependent enzyme [Stappia sp. ES.058]SDU43236.1 Selenocysteine lyase/Cysteine desulfurase [Stappia sp. ES.058]